MRVLIVFLSVLFLCLISFPSSGEDEIPEPDDIDIYDISSGDFLSVDAGGYMNGARMAYSEGDYELSAKYYLTYLTYDPGNTTVIYNLACSYGLLGEAVLASHYAKAAFKAGFMNIDMLENDSDFDSIRDTAEFKEALGEIREQMAPFLIDTERMFLPCKAYSQCHIRVPDDYNPGEARTLIVALAANGGFAYGFSGIYDNFDDPDFIFAAIQGPYPVVLGPYLMYTWDLWPEKGEEPPSDVAALSTGNVANAIEILKLELNADRVFLLGFNDGAAYAYRAGLAIPGLVDGIISFEGHLDTGFISDATLEKGNGIPIFIVHNLAREDDASELLGTYGYDVTLYEYEGEPCEETAVYGEIQKWMAVGK